MSTTTFDDNAFLGDVRDWLREHIDDGAKCPACTQLAKVYRRKVTAGQAQAIIMMWRTHGRDWFHLPTIHHLWRSRDESFLRYWDLIEEEKERREDGGRSGWWRVTQKGEDYVKGNQLIPKYARIYDSRCLGFSGESVSIRDALGTTFNYSDLMAGV